MIPICRQDEWQIRVFQNIYCSLEPKEKRAKCKAAAGLSHLVTFTFILAPTPSSSGGLIILRPNCLAVVFHMKAGFDIVCGFDGSGAFRDFSNNDFSFLNNFIPKSMLFQTIHGLLAGSGFFITDNKRNLFVQ